MTEVMAQDSRGDYPRRMTHDADDATRDERDPVTVLLDNRGLEPPLPMMRTLEAFERLEPGQRLSIHNDRVPVYLLPQLEARGATFEIDERPGGDAVVTIRRAEAAAVEPEAEAP
jgi:uncharacterized protein (DUF2249 family)